MRLPFSTDADVSKITEDLDLMISRVLHKAVIEVNEQGNEAAAVTVVEMVETAVEPLVFSADRPFLFFIRDDRSNTILFMGKYTGPEA